MAASPDIIAAFIAVVRDSFDPRHVETFWDCESALCQLVERGEITKWINQELQRLCLNDQHQGDWSVNKVFLHREAGYELSLELSETPGRYIHALPFLGMYIPLRSSIAYDRYRLPPDFRSDVFNPAARLIPDGCVKTDAHRVIRIESDRYAYDMKAQLPTPVLRLITAPVRPLEWLFSKNTLQAWQANDADLSFTQLRIAAHVLGKIAHQSSIEPLRKLSSHPHHAVRWAAIQNLGRLNRSEALIKIREAVRDPHPHVRRAALKTLERLEGGLAAPD